MPTSNDNLAGPADDYVERALHQGLAPESATASDGDYSRSNDSSTLRYSNGGKDFDYREVFAFKGHFPAHA